MYATNTFSRKPINPNPTKMKPHVKILVKVESGTISPYPIVQRVTIVKYTASKGLKVVVPLKLPVIMYTATPVATYKETPIKESPTIKVDDLCGSEGSLESTAVSANTKDGAERERWISLLFMQAKLALMLKELLASLVV